MFEDAILFMLGKRSRYEIRRAECGLREEFARFHDLRDYYEEFDWLICISSNIKHGDWNRKSNLC